MVYKGLQENYMEEVPKHETTEDKTWNGEVVRETFSQLFLKEKKDTTDDPRMLMNMKDSGCNASQQKRHHKMMDIRDAKLRLKPGDYLGMWDYANWYHQNKKPRPLRRLTRFRVLDTDNMIVRKIQYKSLAQGESWSVILSDEVNEAPLQHLEATIGLRRVTKVDDNLYGEQNAELFLKQGYATMWALTYLGFIMKCKKCRFTLTQRIEWHGFVICTVTAVVFMPTNKLDKAAELTLMLKHKLQDNKASVTPKEVARVTGTLSSMSEGVEECRMNTMELLRLEQHLRNTTQYSLDKHWWDRQYATSRLPLELKTKLIMELEIWHTTGPPNMGDTLTCNNSQSSQITQTTILDLRNKDEWHLKETSMPWNGKMFFMEDMAHIAQTDACNHSWGLTMEKSAMHPAISRTRVWTEKEAAHHITWKETSATARGAIEIMKMRSMSNTTLLMETDNICSRKYNSGGGRLYHLNQTVKEAQQLARALCVILRVRYKPGIEMDNLADIESRLILTFREWKLSPTILTMLETRFGKMQIDMFAQPWNHVCKHYITNTISDTQALAYDSMKQDWNSLQQQGKLFMHTPKSNRFLWRVLNKIETEKVTEAVLLVPGHLNAHLHRIMSMATAIPIIIQCNKHTLAPPKAYTMDKERPLQNLPESEKSWYKAQANQALIGVPVSNSSDAVKAFRSTLRNKWGKDTKKEVENILMRTGEKWSPTREKLNELIKYISTALS
jgi:hypothetical protein